VEVLADVVGRDAAPVDLGLVEQEAKHKKRKTTARNRETMRRIREEKDIILMRILS
jgi:hypothetical protein